LDLLRMSSPNAEVVKRGRGHFHLLLFSRESCQVACGHHFDQEDAPRRQLQLRPSLPPALRPLLWPRRLCLPLVPL
ncbi:hypothetical protein PENTCL1PPCAC_19829, partial [Pristionchus entomophagus]